jgi:hypothetical protein
MSKGKTLAIFLGAVCILTACTSKSNPQLACIPPFTDFAYYTGQGTPYPDKPIAPPSPWMSDATVDLNLPELLGIRILPNQVKEFWFWDASLLTRNQNARQQQLFVFNSDEPDLKPVLLDTGLAEFAYPVEKLFVAPDNSVWVVHRTSAQSQVAILGKYNEQIGRIVPVKKLDKMEHYFNYQTVVLMDEKTGMFWLLVPFGYIYSYDPSSDTLVQHISISDMEPTAAVFTTDGKIYMYINQYGSPDYETHDALFLFSPQTETIEYVPVGLEVDFYMKNLFIDHSGRLWTDVFGWREPDGKWYQMVRSPVFVLPFVEAGGDRLYHWIPPIIRFETSHDVFWFTNSQGGTYSLDFKKGEWCWVSTSSQREQDASGDLWMLVGRQLYRLPRVP